MTIESFSIRRPTPPDDFVSYREQSGGAWLVVGLVAALGVLHAVAGPARAAAGADRPNVLVVVTDDQRPDTIGALGNPVIRTPNLDRLVDRGTAFTRAVASYPLCVPSRSEILTGCTAFRNGVYPGHGVDPTDGLASWAEAMRKAGYRTWYVGKWMSPGRPDDHGYQEVGALFASGRGDHELTHKVDGHGVPVTGYRGWMFQTMDKEKVFPEKGVGLTTDISETFADATIDFIERDPEAPFFLHVNFTAPHDPLLMPSGYEDMYDPKAMPLPPNFKPKHPFDHGNLRGRDEKLLPFPRTPEIVREDLALYYSVISHMDAQIGRMLDALEKTGEADDTLILFTSDHGLAMGSHGLRGKQNMYEHTVGVPLILAGPGIPSGERRAAQANLRDLYPTVADLTGVSLPNPVDGRSLVPVLNGEKDRVRKYAFGYFYDAQRMIRGDRWKLIVYPQADKTQLFDLKRDPYELDNLADEPAHADRRKRLRAELKAWRKRVGDPLLER